ncbi:MAG: hypothetical protein ABI308_02815 [Mucilaginibacter sp.]
MKKLILSTIALLAFSVAIAVFQISCTKQAISQTLSYVLPPATTSKLGGVIPDGTTISVDATGKISTMGSGNTVQQQGKLIYGVFGATEAANAIYTANFDGSNAQKINITLPSGIVVDPDNVRLSPDQKTIFFTAHMIPPATVAHYIYSCNIDGSNIHQLPIPSSANGYNVNVVY